MSGRSALRVGDREVLSGIGLVEGQATAGFRLDALRAPRSLRWIRGLLPGAEGEAWWAEVISCLAETPDSGERRQYVRSYRRSVPRLVWTSWTPQVRCVAPAPVGAGYSSINWKGTKVATLSPEEKFGIRYRNPGPRTIDQQYSLLIGIIAIVLGIIGFIQTGFTNYTEMTDHYIFGLLQTNGFHNTIYIIAGLLWLLGALTLTPAGNQGINIALAGVLLLVAVLGFLGYWNLLSIPAGINVNNIFHLVLALATLLIGGGLLSSRS
ncbi:MAG: DUF4383 domain-containing protein [Actinobacteria bacterium]|nr:DUF4383 domain-containing protein [Actinomycetota bacterium]